MSKLNVILAASLCGFGTIGGILVGLSVAQRFGLAAPSQASVVETPAGTPTTPATTEDPDAAIDVESAHASEPVVASESPTPSSPLDVHTKSASAELADPFGGSTEYEFIESHRAIQDRKRSRSGEYPFDLRLEYKNLYRAHPESSAHAYLYARLIPDVDERLGFVKSMVEQWPDCAYATSLLAHAHYCRIDPPNPAEALRLARRAARLDERSPGAKFLPRVEAMHRANEKAPRIALGFESGLAGEHGGVRYDLTPLGPRHLRLGLVEKKTTYTGRRLRDTWHAHPKIRIELSPEGWMLVDSLHAIGGGSGIDIPVFCYAIRQHPANASLSLTLIGAPQGQTDRFISRDDFKAARGTYRLYLTPEELEGMSEIRIDSIYVQ